MTEFGKTPFITVSEFEDMGYSIVIFPLTGFRVMLKAVQEALEKLKAEGTQKDLIEKMLTRKGLYELIDYNDYEGIDKKISNKFK